MPRIVCLSDTHNAHSELEVPEGDILVHAGDATNAGSLDEIAAFLDWFASRPHPEKVFVAGNHDWLFEIDGRIARAMAAERGITYLQDSAAEVCGLRFYGSPWQPRFFDWAFNLERGRELAEKWALIPADTEVLVTHCPPYLIGDEVSGALGIVNGGCEDLRRRVSSLAGGPLRLHVFGHFHFGYGRYEELGIRFVNAANCDEDYRPVQPPIVVDL